MSKVKDCVTIITWSEIDWEDLDEGQLTTKFFENFPNTCTDDELVLFLREKNEDDPEDPDGAWGKDWLGRENTWSWRCASLIRNENIATVEWRSDRDHISISTVVWS